MKVGLITKIAVLVLVVLLLSGVFLGTIQGKDLKVKKGYFKGREFNNGRIILDIKDDGSFVIKDAKSGKVLIEKGYVKLEIKKGEIWKNVSFKVKIKEKDWKKWHIVKVKLRHKEKGLKIRGILEFRQKKHFKLYKPLYPQLKLKIRGATEYRLTWCYEGVKLRHFEIIDNGSGETRAPYRDGHGRRIIYNGTIEGNRSFADGQDILIGWNDGEKEFGFNWELEKNVYRVLQFLEKTHPHTVDIHIPATGNISSGGIIAHRPPIPDSGGGGEQDSDGDGLYDSTEEAGWDIEWYDAEGKKHTKHVTSDPHSRDTDGDGLTDKEEWEETDPQNGDTDGDGLSDYREEKSLGTSPIKADTDGDALTDYEEVHGWYVWSEGKWVSSDPRKEDTDGDGLTDFEEWNMDTDPRSVDTDGDGLLDSFDDYPTIKDDEKPKMDVPHIYASNHRWWIKNLYVEDNSRVAQITVKYYVGSKVRETKNFFVYASRAWINTSVKDDIWDYVAGNKIEVIVTDVNGNRVTFSYSHDLYTDLKSIWNKISKFVSGAIINAVKNLISKYPDLAPLIALGWALGESLWSNSIGGLIDIVKDPGKFIEGIKSFINALKSNGVMNTITAVLDGIKEEIESKVNTLVSYISDATKRNEVRQQCFNMFVVGEIIGFVVAMAIQPDGFPTGLSKFIEKLGSSGSKLAEAFGKIANTIEKMKSLLRDAKSLALGKLMEKSSALKAAVKELVQSGKMSEKTKELMNRVAQWFGKDGVSREENMIKDIAKKLEDGTDSEDIELALEDVKEEYTGGDTGKEKEIFDEHVSFYKYLDGLEHDEDLIKAFGSRAALKKYIEDAKKGYRLVGDEAKKSDFENTLKSALSAVKKGLVEKNTKKNIINIIKGEGYKPEKVYLYAILPRKALVGNQEAIDMLRNVWTKILEKYPLKNGFGRVVKIDKNTLKELVDALARGDKSKAEEIIRNLKDSKGRFEFGHGKGIFRVSDIHGTTPAEVYEELRGTGDASGRVIIELRTESEVSIMDPLEHYNEVSSKWHYPYTGTGFIASKDGEILPEYYLFSHLTDSEGNSLEIVGIKLIDTNGKVYAVGW